MSLTKEIESYQRYLAQTGYSAASLRAYGYLIRRYLRDYPQAPRADRRAVQSAIGQRLRQYPDSSTARLHLSAIKAYYDYLITSGQRDNHPCRSLNLKGQPKRAEILASRLFQREELEALFEAREESYAKMRWRNQALLSLLIYQGLSAGEAATLPLRALDLDSGTIQIKASRSLQGRTLALHPRQYRILDRYLHEGRPALTAGSGGKSLLLNYRGHGIGIDDVQYLLETLRGYYPERRLNAKTIRQSVIYHWVNVERLPVADVQLMAGFALPSSVARYQQESIEDRRARRNQFWPLQ